MIGGEKFEIVDAGGGDDGAVGGIAEGVAHRSDFERDNDGYWQDVAERIIIDRSEYWFDATFDASNTKGGLYAWFIQRDGTDRKGLIVGFEIV